MIFFGNTDAGVDDAEINHVAMGFDLDIDTAAAGEFYGVSNEVQQNLFDVVAVRSDPGHRLADPIPSHCGLIVLGPTALPIENFLHQFAKMELRQPDRHLAAFKPGNIKHIIDVLHQQATRDFHIAAILLLFARHLRVAQEGQVAEQPV